MPERPATLRDVAAAARVHPATASRALNPETRILVSEDTARRVSEAAGRETTSRCPTSPSTTSTKRSSASKSSAAALSTQARGGRSAATPKAARSGSRVRAKQPTDTRLRYAAISSVAHARSSCAASARSCAAR